MVGGAEVDLHALFYNRTRGTSRAHAAVHSGLTALVLVRVVPAVVHPVADLLGAQADAVVPAAERPCRRTGMLCCSQRHKS